MTETDWRDTVVSHDSTHHLRGDAPLYGRRFEEVLKFHAPGLAPARDASGMYHIDTSGNPAYGTRFRRTFGFYEGLAAVEASEGWCHILPDGLPAYAARWTWAGNFQGGRCPVRQHDGLYLHIQSDGAALYDDRWRYAGDFRDGIAVVQAEDGRSTHINALGRVIHGVWFVDLDVFHKGFARARDDRGWMHVDELGNAVYADRFAMVEPFYNGQARVERFDGALAVIDERGATLRVLRGSVHRRTGKRPKLLLIGLPGSGKTTLAALLGPRLGLEVVQLDALRNTHGDGSIAGDYSARTAFLRACAAEAFGLYEFGATGQHRVGVRQAFREGQSRVLTIWVDTPTAERRARLAHRHTHIPLPDWGVAAGAFDDEMERLLQADFASGFWSSDAGWTAMRVDGTHPVKDTVELAAAAWAAMVTQ